MILSCDINERKIHKQKWSVISIRIVVMPFVYVLVIIHHSLRRFLLYHSLPFKEVRAISNLWYKFIIIFLLLFQGSNVEIPSSLFSINHSHHVLIWLVSIGRKEAIAVLHCRVFLCYVGLLLYMEKSTACLVNAIVVILCCCCCCISYVTSDALDHRYKEGDSVPFYTNKVGPFHNPRSDFHSLSLSLAHSLSPFHLPFKIFQS